MAVPSAHLSTKSWFPNFPFVCILAIRQVLHSETVWANRQARSTVSVLEEGEADVEDHSLKLCLTLTSAVHALMSRELSMGRDQTVGRENIVEMRRTFTQMVSQLQELTGDSTDILCSNEADRDENGKLVVVSVVIICFVFTKNARQTLYGYCSVVPTIFMHLDQFAHNCRTHTLLSSLVIHY